MVLTFTIENETSLPDGGPISITISGKRGFDVGRDTHLDWTLPDPDLVISGKHCEVRFHDGAYWLHDLSRNGTFLNGSPSRMVEPHRLRTNDRLTIGRYIITVTVDGIADTPAAVDASREVRSSARPSNEWWSAEDETPPPIDPRELKPIAQAAVSSDFLSWAHEPQGFVQIPTPPSEDRSVWTEDADWIKSAPAKPQEPAPSRFQEPPPSRWEEEPAVSQVQEPAAQRQAQPEPDPQISLPAISTPPVSPPVAPPPAAPAPVRMPQVFADPVFAESAAPSVDYGAQPDAAASVRFLRLFAESAGLPQDALAHLNPDDFARLLGSLMHTISGDMMQLLRARYEAKKMARGGDQTMIEATANNPLKFSPSAEDALRIMFGRPTSRYLDAAPAFRQAFDDLKRHQIATLSAMQGAAKMLVEDLEPKSIEASLVSEGALAKVLGSRKARLWDTYVARWNAKAQLHDDGLLGAFMYYFPQCYDRGRTD